MPVVSRRYRFSLFALLILVVLLGTGLALVIARTGQQVNAAATPLLKEKLPLLRHITRLEGGFMHYQITLNQYFAYSINRDRFYELLHQDEKEIGEHLSALQRAFGDTEAMRSFRASYENAKTLGPKLDKLINKQPVDWDEARAVLVELSIDTTEMRSKLDVMEKQTEDTVYAGGELTSKSVANITSLVYLYGVITLLTALFVAHHIRARLRSEDELAYQAVHDPLTGLPNRRSLEQALGDMAEQPHHIALLAIDRFERVIGGLGHEAADRLLAGISERINAVTREFGGTLFKLDGASFALLRPCSGERAEIQRSLSEFMHTMRHPFEINSYEVNANLSIGVARYPDDGATPTQLLQRADAALQAARLNGGDGFALYTQDLNTQGLERLELEGHLSHALERQELQLYYQPQQQLAGDRLIGFEALVRWRKGDKLVSPADFIPLAEESGLIVPIGAWILAEACRQTLQWAEQGRHELVIAVNISARQFQHPDFVQMVKDTLASTRVDPANIELEITESVIMQDAERTIAQLLELRALGLKLAIDDFGTGYSSLAYLKRFPLDKLKIDQSFIRNLQPSSGDAAIVQAVIGLGQSLGLHVIAEGVETADQREALRDWQCDEIQGYFYARPLTAEAATAFLAAH